MKRENKLLHHYPEYMPFFGCVYQSKSTYDVVILIVYFSSINNDLVSIDNNLDERHISINNDLMS